MIRYKRLIALCVALVLGSTSGALAFETKARQMVVLDDASGQILMQKDADAQMHPASMTKMMTIYLLFKALKEGKLTLDSTLPVSEKAWRIQGSKMFVELGGQIRVEDLIRGILIQSGNDACIVVAEGLAGTEEAFADLMNEQATKLGMTGSHFLNSNGWPDDNHLSTAHDMAVLLRALIRDFPEYYHYFAEEEYTYHGIRQYNRNAQLHRGIGVDGGKTGHTEISGYGITTTAKKPDGRRLIVVVHGLSGEKERIEEAAAVLQYAFGAYDRITLAKKGDIVERVHMLSASEDEAGLTVASDAFVTLPKLGRDQVTFTLSYQAPLIAPIPAGAPVANLIVRAPQMQDQVIALVTAGEVEKAGIFKTAFGNLKALLGGM